MRTTQTTISAKPSIVKVWMLQNNLSPEDLASSLRVSFYTVRKLLRGEAVSQSLIELLSMKSNIEFSVLVGSHSDVTTNVAKSQIGNQS
jgi:transcriptional regulator with XRE-family HTH domain